MPTVNLSPLFNGQTVFGSTSLPLASGKIYTYQAGSSTPWATYTDANGNVANANPIILGTDAKLPNELWLQSGYSYKYVLKDENDVIVNTYDNIAGILTQIPTTSPAVPAGCILIWSGATGSIPSGFVICDGTNGTPDLRDKFVIGAGNAYSVGQTGGSANSIVVTHTHTATTSVSDPGHNHVINISDPGHFHALFAVDTGVSGSNGGTGQSNLHPPTSAQTDSRVTNITATSNSNTTGISASTSISSEGQSGTNANLPPYYALAFIMKS